MHKVPFLYKITLREKTSDYQRAKRESFDSRTERLSFNALVYLSTVVFGKKSPTTANQYLEPSTSKAKLGMDEFAEWCIEIESEEPVDDFCEELRELIRQKKESRKKKLSAQLNFLDKC